MHAPAQLKAVAPQPVVSRITNIAHQNEIEESHDVMDLRDVFKNSLENTWQNPAGGNGKTTGKANITPKLSHSFQSIPVHATTALIVQPKLAINKPGDEYEQEADAVADKVMNKNVVETMPVKTAPVNPARRNTVNNVNEKVKEPVVSAAVNQALQSPGQPLDEDTRSFMEPRFGFDFRKVQIHNNPQAHRSAKEINALAYTYGNNIVFGEGQYQPQTDKGKKLLSHELTHVVQQSGAAGSHAGDSRDYCGLLQRTPEQAQILISDRTAWGNLDETALGREMLRLVLNGELTLADEVLTELGSTDRDDVAYELMRITKDSQLVRLGANSASRRFLNRLFDELTSGSVSAEEQQQADRIQQAIARQIVSVTSFETAATSQRTKIFPFRLPGLTVLSDAPIEARRERGGVWVRSVVRVLSTPEFRAETATLPIEYFLNGIVLPENEVIGVRLYDQGGIIQYTTPLFLVQLANATNQQVLEKVIEAAGIGLTLGTGALAGLGVEASMTARVLLWADRAAIVLGTVTSVLREHRSWLVEQFGSDFMDAVDIVHSAAAIYGIARVAIEAPRIILGLRNSYRAFRESARSRSSGFSLAQQTTIRQVTQSTDELIEQVDNIQGAHSTPQTGPQRSTGQVLQTERPMARPSADTEPTIVGNHRTQETSPERASSGPAAAGASGPGSTYRPSQAELEGYADRAWRLLGGRGPRPSVTETPLRSGTLGQYRSSPRTIEVGTGASSPGSVIDTVWHEASHGRIRDLIGFMNEHLGASWQRTMLRPMDEIVSYFIGGLGRVIQGPTLSNRLFGILNMLGAPFTAIGSMATNAERALWAAHMVAFAAALIWAEIKILLAIQEHRDSETSQPAPAP